MMTSLSGQQISAWVDTLGGSVLVGGEFSRSSSKSSISSPNASIGAMALAPVVYLEHDSQRARKIIKIELIRKNNRPRHVPDFYPYMDRVYHVHALSNLYVPSVHVRVSSVF